MKFNSKLKFRRKNIQKLLWGVAFIFSWVPAFGASEAIQGLSINVENIDWVAISAVIIAGCALFLSVYESRQNRKHFKLSNKPNLKFDTSIKPRSPITVKLSNKGLGPAIIKNVLIGCDKNSLTNADGESIKKIVQGNNLEGRRFNYFFSNENDVLGAGDVITFLEFLFKDDESSITEHEHNQNLVAEMLKKLIIKIEYTDIFGEKILFDDKLFVNYRGMPNLPVKT